MFAGVATLELEVPDGAGLDSQARKGGLGLGRADICGHRKFLLGREARVKRNLPRTFWIA
jgi:hypothetical protein